MHTIMSFRNELGSALVLVLVLISALTIVCMLTLTGVYSHTRSLIHSEQSIKAFYVAEAAIQKTLWLLSGNMGKDATWRPIQENIEVYDHKTASVTVTDWGGFLRIVAEATWGQRRETICVLAGINPPDDYKYAVILGGVNFPLVVTGHNQIIGDVLVGMKGVETGMIEGQGFMGSDPVQGNIVKIPELELPIFDPSPYQKAFQTLQTGSIQSDLIQTIYQDVIVDSVFMNNTEAHALHVSGDVTLISDGHDPLLPDFFSISCTGNMTVRGIGNLGHGIQLISQGQLEIQDAPMITNGLIYSGQRLIITHNGQLSGQFFSPDQIYIGGSTHLQYPSILFCSGHTINNHFAGDIQIVDKAFVEGAVILCPFIDIPDSMKEDFLIHIGTSAMVKGIVYSTHTTILEGIVHGCVATETFSLYIKPTTYINWLTDATIDRTQLSDSFDLPLGFDIRPRFRIVMWEDFNASSVIQSVQLTSEDESS